jgi:hypothetical protein
LLDQKKECSAVGPWASNRPDRRTAHFDLTFPSSLPALFRTNNQKRSGFKKSYLIGRVLRFKDGLREFWCFDVIKTSDREPDAIVCICGWSLLGHSCSSSSHPMPSSPVFIFCQISIASRRTPHSKTIPKTYTQSSTECLLPSYFSASSKP